MRIIARKMLRNYWEEHPETKGILVSWLRKVLRAHWRKGQDVIADYPKASLIAEDRAYFRLGPVRLVVGIDYTWETVFTKWVGDKKEVMHIDTLTVDES